MGWPTTLSLILAPFMPLPLGQKPHIGFPTYETPSQVLADDPIGVKISEGINSPLGLYNREVGK
jgi:hypothetical protein